MQDIENRRVELRRVRIFTSFDRSQRTWWTYLLVAAERWLSWNDDAALRAACDRLIASPENDPDEAARWLDLRSAAENVLKQQGMGAGV